MVHPHIAALYGVCDQPLGAQRALHFLMEYGNGGGLDRQLEPGGRLHSSSAEYPLGGWKRTAEVARIGYQAALGLLHAHARGYAHCDVKLANLVLSEPFNTSSLKMRKKTGHVLVTDFGLASRVRQRGHVARAEGAARHVYIHES